MPSAAARPAAVQKPGRGKRPGAAAHPVHAVHHRRPLRRPVGRRRVRHAAPRAVLLGAGGGQPAGMRYFCGAGGVVPLPPALSHPAGAGAVAEPLAVHRAADAAVLVHPRQRCGPGHAAIRISIPGQHPAAVVCGPVYPAVAAVPGAQPAAACRAPPGHAGLLAAVGVFLVGYPTLFAEDGIFGDWLWNFVFLYLLVAICAFTRTTGFRG